MDYKLMPIAAFDNIQRQHLIGTSPKKWLKSWIKCYTACCKVNSGYCTSNIYGFQDVGVL